MKRTFKVIGFGLLLFIITMALLFGLSMIAGSEQPTGFWWIGVIMAVVLACGSLWFSRRLRATTSKQAFGFGLIWATMVAGIILIITIPNGTTDVFFGEWSAYLVFVGIAVGPVLMKPKLVRPDA